MQRSELLLVTVLGVSTALGCQSNPSTQSPVATAEVAAPTGSGPASAASTQGSTPAGAEAEVTRLAKAAAACPFSGGQPAYDCPALTAFHDTSLTDDGAQDATLVGLLDAADPKLRSVALIGLDQRGFSKQTYPRDPALAARVVAAAEKEKDDLVDPYLLGQTVGRIQVGSTGLWDRVKALLTAPGRVRFRMGILWNVAAKNRDDDAVYALVKGMLSDPEADIRKGVTMALTGDDPKHHDETCKLWAASFQSADPQVATTALNAIGTAPCKAQFDAFLDLATPRVKAGGVEYQGIGASVLGILRKQSGGTDAQRKRAFALCKLIAENPKNEAIARGAMLEEVVAYDPPGAKAWLKKLTSDADIGERAHDLLAAQK